MRRNMDGSDGSTTLRTARATPALSPLAATRSLIPAWPRSSAARAGSSTAPETTFLSPFVAASAGSPRLHAARVDSPEQTSTAATTTFLPCARGQHQFCAVLCCGRSGNVLPAALRRAARLGGYYHGRHPDSEHAAPRCPEEIWLEPEEPTGAPPYRRPERRVVRQRRAADHRRRHQREFLTAKYRRGHLRDRRAVDGELPPRLMSVPDPISSIVSTQIRPRLQLGIRPCSLPTRFIRPRIRLRCRGLVAIQYSPAELIARPQVAQVVIGIRLHLHPHRRINRRAHRLGCEHASGRQMHVADLVVRTGQPVEAGGVTQRPPFVVAIGSSGPQNAIAARERIQEALRRTHSTGKLVGSCADVCRRSCRQHLLRAASHSVSPS